MSTKIGRLVCAISAAVVVSAFAQNAQAEKRVLQYGSALPAKHIGNKIALVPFFDEVNKKTSNVEWRLFTGGAMGNFKEAFTSVKDRVVDGAAIVDVYAAQFLPRTATLSGLSLMGTDPRVMAGAMNQTVLVDRPDLIGEWQRHKVRPMAAYALSPFHMMCREKLLTLASLQGKKISATSGYARLVKAIGAVPITIESTEIYEALRRGQVDCVVASSAWLKSFSLWDVVKSYNELPVGLFFGAWILTFNDDSWNAMSASEKKAHSDSIPSMIRKAVEQYSFDGVNVRGVAEKEKGITYFKADQDYRDAVAVYQKEDVANVIRLAKGRGVENPEELIGSFLANVKKWKKIVSSAGADYDAYEAALKREIFDKISY
jgi:TRAP-type transport system periplasmic protein